MVPGAAAPKLVTRDMIKQMRPGSVIVDIAIDQGGCFETSKATTHSDPTYVVDEVVHCAFKNMKGAGGMAYRSFDTVAMRMRSPSSVNDARSSQSSLSSRTSSSFRRTSAS